jgi:hypothetical protein
VPQLRGAHLGGSAARDCDHNHYMKTDKTTTTMAWKGDESDGGFPAPPYPAETLPSFPVPQQNLVPRPLASPHHAPQVPPTTPAHAPIPDFIHPMSVAVNYDSTALQVGKRRQAHSVISHSNQTLPTVTNVIGSYLDHKDVNEQLRINRGVTGEYGRSKPAVQYYNHIMHKLEKLSGDLATSRSIDQANWRNAIGPFRRRAFIDLYNSDNIVRCFAKELPGGPLQLPELTPGALGIQTNTRGLRRAAWQTVNLRGPVNMELLSRVRTVVLVDDSGSMYESGHMSWENREYRNGANESRWDQARSLLAGVAPLVSLHNNLGIDIHFLNRPTFYTGMHTEQDVLQAFDAGRPNNGTPTGQRVNDILDGYMSTLRYCPGLMPLHLIVITDGEANDEKLLHWAIEEHVTKIVQRGYQAHQLGIEFVQVGDCRMATEHLERLEEEVSRHHLMFQRDVVGVTPATRVSAMNPDLFLAIMLSGIDARVNGYMRRRGVNV